MEKTIRWFLAFCVGLIIPWYLRDLLLGKILRCGSVLPYEAFLIPQRMDSADQGKLIVNNNSVLTAL
jgi:hypothetical protein